MTGALERIKVMERLIRAGQVDTGVTRNIRMFRVSTIQEVVSVRVLVEDNSYLVQRKNDLSRILGGSRSSRSRGLSEQIPMACDSHLTTSRMTGSVTRSTGSTLS